MEIKRRRFLQLVGAAGLAPVLPSLPVSAGAASQSGSTAQMLWASMYRRAGSTQAVAGLTQTMGISGTATQGVVTKLVQANIVAVNSAANLSRAARSVSAVKSAPVVNAVKAPSIKVDVVKFLTEDPDDVAEAVEIEETPGDEEIV